LLSDRFTSEIRHGLLTRRIQNNILKKVVLTITELLLYKYTTSGTLLNHTHYTSMISSLWRDTRIIHSQIKSLDYSMKGDHLYVKHQYRKWKMQP